MRFQFGVSKLQVVSTLTRSICKPHSYDQKGGFSQPCLQGGSGTEPEPETGTVGTVFPETESRTGTAGTVFQEPKPEPEPSFPVKLKLY